MGKANAIFASVSLTLAALADVPALTDEMYLEFSRTGDRARYERPFFERTARLRELREAEVREKSGRHIPEIVEYVEAICAERTWVGPAHDEELAAFNGACKIDLFAAMRCLEIAETCDALKETLPPAVRELAVRECRRRVLDPYLFLARNFRDEAKRAQVEPNRRWFDGRWNWNSVCHSCVVRAALLLVRDPGERAEFVAAADYAAPFALAGFFDDGYCAEGAGYWNYGYGHHALMALAIREATGGATDLFRDPKNRLIAEYGYKIQMERGKAPEFSDSCEPPAEWLLDALEKVYPGMRAKFTPLPARSFFECAQVLVSRGKGFSLAVTGGNNDMPHNHDDLGSYVVMLDGAALAGDPGREEYTGRTFSALRYESRIVNSYGHPVPVVDLRLQGTGRQFFSRVAGVSFCAERDEIVYDLTAAYPECPLKSLVRRIVFDRAASRVEIEDSVVFDEPSHFEVPFIARGALRPLGEPGRYVVEHPSGGRDLALKVEASEAFVVRREKLEGAAGADVARLGFSLAGRTRAATIRMTLAPEGCDAP